MKSSHLLIATALAVSIGTPAWADRGDHGPRHYSGGPFHHGHNNHHGHRGHLNFGVTIGPYWGSGFFPPPIYYAPSRYPTVVVEQAPAMVYVEQPAFNTSPPPQQNYWYYCEASRTYYPYVTTCAGNWQRVSPRPPGQP